MSTIESISIFVAAASFFGFLYEMRFKDEIIAKRHNILVANLDKFSKFELISVFYRSIELSEKILSYIYGERRNEYYILGYISNRSWKASTTIAIIYCLISPVCVGLIIVAVSNLFFDDSPTLNARQVISLLFYMLLTLAALYSFVVFLIKTGLKLPVEARFVVVFSSFVPLTIWLLVIVFGSAIGLYFSSGKIPDYILNEVAPSLFVLYITSVLTAFLVSIWLYPISSIVSPILAHTTPALLVFGAIIIYGIFFINPPNPIYSSLFYSIIVIVLFAATLSTILIPFHSELLRTYRFYNASLISIYFSQFLLLYYVLDRYWAYFAIFMAVWGIVYTFVIINGLADTISVAITRQILNSILHKKRWYRLLYYIIIDAIGAVICMMAVFLLFYYGRTSHTFCFYLRKFDHF